MTFARWQHHSVGQARTTLGAILVVEALSLLCWNIIEYTSSVWTLFVWHHKAIWPVKHLAEAVYKYVPMDKFGAWSNLPLAQNDRLIKPNLTVCVFYVVGIQGILSAYQMCLSQVQLYGPTNFAPIIYHVAQFAAASKSEPTPKVWFFLLQWFQSSCYSAEMRGWSVFDSCQHLCAWLMTSERTEWLHC